MKWTRMLGGAVALSAAFLLPAASAAAQIPGQCASSATDCTPSGSPGAPGGNVNETPGGGTDVPEANVSDNVDQPGETSAGGENAGISEEQSPAEAEGGVLGITAEQGAPAMAAAEGPAGGSVGGLAFTGGDVIQLTALGVGSIVVGSILMRRGRRGRAVTA